MRKALVTGASSGLGREFARTLAVAGTDLVIVARDKARLAELAQELQHKFSVKVEVLSADLSTEQGLQLVSERLLDESSPIDLLVNNAGMGLGQEFVGGDIARELHAANVMVNAVMVLTHAALTTMTTRNSGTIINVSSITSMTVQGTYSAHKAWVKVFTESMAADLADAGSKVQITAVMPGLMHTEFHERVNVDAGQWQEFMFIKPAKVARLALAGASKGKVLVIPSGKYKLMYGLLKIAPRNIIRKFASSKASGRV